MICGLGTRTYMSKQLFGGLRGVDGEEDEEQVSLGWIEIGKDSIVFLCGRIDDLYGHLDQLGPALEAEHLALQHHVIVGVRHVGNGQMRVEFGIGRCG